MNGKRHFTALQWLIIINVTAFVVARLAMVVAMLTGGERQVADVIDLMLAMPMAPDELVLRPWTLLSHMFAHIDLWHIIINMLWLWWMGNLFMEFFSGRQLVALYLLGGVAGAAAAILFFLAFRHLSGPALLIGASGAVTAIMLGITAYRPTYRVNLFLIGTVQLKWVAIVIVAIDVLCLGSNTGGHIAHLGGAATGLAFGYLVTRGTDITRLLTAPLDLWTAWRAKSLNQTTKDEQRKTNSAPSEREVDEVLVKVRRSGYDSLTAAERDLLARASRDGYHN